MSKRKDRLNDPALMGAINSAVSNLSKPMDMPRPAKRSHPTSAPGARKGLGQIVLKPNVIGPIERRRQHVRELAKTYTSPQIAAELGVSLPTIYTDLKSMGIKAITAARGPKVRKGKADQVRKAQDVHGARNGRRFTKNAIPTGQPENELAPDHPAIVADETAFPSMVKDPLTDGPPLKSGKHNRKIGNRVLVGRLQGAPIFTLTLPERGANGLTVCPPCPLRRVCYMNNSPMAHRMMPGPRLEQAVAKQVAELISLHDQILVRIHIGGDFYSEQYAQFWFQMMRAHPGLNVFGFTHHPRESAMGRMISEARATFSPRFEIRFSNDGGAHGSIAIEFPVPVPRLGPILICPEQRDALREAQDQEPKGIHCGSCGACWTGKPTPIAFILH